MKGTLYSSDFVKDANGNLRLLELNTDTTFPSASLSHFDWSNFIEYLGSESIDSIHVIHKSFQENLITHLSESLAGTSITGWETTEELQTTLYPTDVQDTDNKFVLRMAYNESAIFDSEYCKTNKTLYKLYNDYTGSEMVVPHYISSSVDEYVINNLDPIENSHLIPDFVVKKGSTQEVHLQFYKTVGSETGEEKIDLVIASDYEDGDVLTNYIDTSESTDYMNSYRSCNIICGNNLDYISIGAYKISSWVDKPTQLTFDSTGSVSNMVANKHRYEFATNWPKEYWKNQSGVHGEAMLLTTSSEEIEASATAVGGYYKSIDIPDLPDTDAEEAIWSWSLDGNSLPSETAHTASQLISKASESVAFGVITELSGSDDSSFMVGSSLPILCYDVEQDKIRFEKAVNMLTGSFQLLDASGSLVDIVENNLVIFEREEFTYELNMEKDDVFIINNSGVMLVAHNPFYGACFMAGAKIHTEFGDKDIEDIEVGDVVWSWDSENNEYVWSEVSEIHEGMTVGDTLDACRFLGKPACGVFSIYIEDISEDGAPNYLGFEFTANHSFLTKDGWKALAPSATEEPWISEQEDIKYLEVGDYVKYNDLSDSGQWVQIEEINFRTVDPDTPVYNFKVPGTSNYLVNYTVAHNK